MPESKEVLKKQTDGGYVTGTQEPTESGPNGQSWNNLNNNINCLALYYNIKYKKYPSVHNGINK